MADLLTPLRLTSAEFFVLFLVCGLVVWELGEEWGPARAALELVPGAVNAWLGFSGEAANFVHAMVLFVLLPAVAFAIPGFLGGWANVIRLLESVKTFAVMFLPLLALGHVAKALFRITSRLPYYPLAFRDPVGYDTATRIASGDLVPDSTVVSVLYPWISWIGVGVLVAALAAAWWIGLKNPTFKRFTAAGKAPYLASATVYTVALLLVTVFARF